MVGAGTDGRRDKAVGGPVIVLVRPQLAVNIGTATRAMANFGLSTLRLVAPKGGWPPAPEYRATAEAAASNAAALLGAADLYPTVAAAVADLHFVWATTARERGQGKDVRLPEAAMAESAHAMRHADERHGILFGPERTGLDNDEIALADAIVSFPVSPGHGSLNLAQAVLLMAYEWRRAAVAPAAPVITKPPWPRASRAAALGLFDHLETELTAAGYFRPDDKRPVMRRNLRNIFHRIGLTEQDVRTLRGVIVRLVNGPRRHPPP